ncbi:transcriptional regulator [Sphingomonas sinipercae]|uniref:Transcriptional regulator n=1 Tax=Sphingomonas sinipercae TaxID=2714944 RepID=A0A6G7ZQI0_9SPHN|nr:winged helix-turn-helix domain-containing protein [Sphingomonas sinipercae]QIL03160.1 transcriptional regulator [Sphingomonas sinipercae]
MAPQTFAFDRFQLDVADRQLREGDETVEVNARYFDALALLVREHGKLITKDRFLEEVWRGVPVTDEALTQCIKTLRRQLGDSASRPRLIETVPKHGYRFIASVGPGGGVAREAPPAPSHYSAREFLLTGVAGTIGAGMAGLLGGLVYGLLATSDPTQRGAGGISMLLVLVSLTIVVAILGGLGVSFGVAAAGFAKGPQWAWKMAGGAAGGLLVGAFTKLLGVDGFSLLFGQSPGDITGAGEGALTGAAVGLAAWLATRFTPLAPARRSALLGAAVGAVAGLVIILSGGRLMLGSLDLLARNFPNSRLRIDAVGALFGEHGLGPATEAASGALEIALFAAGIVGAMVLARRHFSDWLR